MLAGQITDLAGREVGLVARVVLATVLGVEVTHSGSAVAVGWDRHVVDVVGEWTVLGIVREVAKGDSESYASAALLRDSADAAAHGSAGELIECSLGESSHVGSRRQVGLNRSRAIESDVSWLNGALGDDGTLVGENAAEGSREGRENRGLGSGEEHRWWRRDELRRGKRCAK